MIVPVLRISTVCIGGEGGKAAVLVRGSVTTITRSLSSVTLQETVEQQQQPTYIPRFRSATRELQQHGINALKPSVVVTASAGTATATSLLTIKPQTSIEILQQQIRLDNTKERKKWNKPLLSNRKANVLRKQAILNNTYGTFNTETGIGWNKEWDIELQYNKTSDASKNNNINQSNVGRIRVLKPKLSKHFKSRDDRAKQIESKLIGMDDRIEELHAERQKNKPRITFEYTYNQMVKDASGRFK